MKRGFYSQKCPKTPSVTFPLQSFLSPVLSGAHLLLGEVEGGLAPQRGALSPSEERADQGHMQPERGSPSASRTPVASQPLGPAEQCTQGLPVWV